MFATIDARRSLALARATGFALSALFGLTLLGCAERGASSNSSGVRAVTRASEPATKAPGSPSANAVAEVPAPAASASHSAPLTATSGSAGAPLVVAAPVAAEALAAPPLLDPSGKALPQTEDRPRLDSPSFQERLALLVDAIVHDEPKRALPAFFPVVAYEQVKAVEKPARDWQYRLIRAFEKDVHEYHQALGRDAQQARFEGIDVPEASARWMKPGSEGNRLGYFRVLRSHLRLKKADGTQKLLEITSMISWRGEWYVVHLNGFD